MSRYRNRLGKIVLPLALWSSLGLALGQPLTARVLEPVGDISPYAVSGFNIGNMMQLALYREEFDALDIQALRFPPGNQGDEILLTPAVIDGLKMQWELLGRPELKIIANLFSATPEDAVAAARYFAEVGMPIKAWAIGNEPDLYATNRGDPSWTPETYCESFRSYRAALLEVNPNWEITGPAVSGSRPAGEDYLREVLRLCGDVIDVLTWHIYPTDGTWEDEAALATSRQVGEEIRRYRAWLDDPEMNPLGYERDIGLAITEFGLSWRTANYRHLEDMPAALWLADALGQMAVEGLDESYYFALQALGGHGLIDRSGWVRPTYYVFEKLSDFGGEALSVELEASPLLTAYAAGNERGLQVLFVNRSTEDSEVALELEGDLEVKTLNDEIFDESLSYRMSVQGADESVSVPARSVVLVQGAR
jgi:hypothetical protein